MQEREDSRQDKANGLSVRAVILGCMLSALFTLVNSYLQINFGIGLGFGARTVHRNTGLTGSELTRKPINCNSGTLTTPWFK